MDPEEPLTLDDLNLRYWKWLEEDYHCKKHSSINSSPLEFFMGQSDQVRMISDPRLLDEHFLLREERKVEADGNISIENLKYQVDNPLILAGKRVEVRFEPEWIGHAHYPLPIYIEDKKVGQATLVDFVSNAKAKRRRPDKTRKATEPGAETTMLDPTLPKLNFSSIYKASSEGGED